EERATALIFLRHHIDDGMKYEHLIIKNVGTLWLIKQKSRCLQPKIIVYHVMINKPQGLIQDHLCMHIQLENIHETIERACGKYSQNGATPSLLIGGSSL
ncbi:hypothetical protein CFOL_v3_00937, partial [Cephalotus follicularis]